MLKYKNKIRCKKCGTILESKYRHDLQICKCGVFVDGGLDYQRLGWPDGEIKDWIEIIKDEINDEE